MFYYLQSANQYDPFLYKSVMLITQVICRGAYIPIMSVLSTPMRCNLKTGEMVDFQGLYCFENPNLILFILSFIPILLMIIISVLNYQL